MSTNTTENKPSNFVSTVIVPLAFLLALKIGGPIYHEAFGPKLPTYPADGSDPWKLNRDQPQEQIVTGRIGIGGFGTNYPGSVADANDPLHLIKQPHQGLLSPGLFGDKALGTNFPSDSADAGDPLHSFRQRHQGQLFHSLKGEAAPALFDAWKQAADRSRLEASNATLPQ